MTSRHPQARDDAAQRARGAAADRDRPRCPITTNPAIIITSVAGSGTETSAPNSA